MKIALVTGASRGIGAQTAISLAHDGYCVVVNYNNSKSDAENVVKTILNFGGQAFAIKADVSKADQVNQMILQIKQKFGTVDLLVNNAAIAEQKMFTDINLDSWNKMINTNLTGIFNCTQSVIKDMINNQSGNIINVSSIWGLTGASCEVHYSTTKAAIIGFTKSLAKEMGLSGINVNCVAPGVILTDMNSQLDEQTLDQLKEETPLNRLGTAKDIADTICFLASDKARFITGQVISPNGGILI